MHRLHYDPQLVGFGRPDVASPYYGHIEAVDSVGAVGTEGGVKSGWESGR